MCYWQLGDWCLTCVVSKFINYYSKVYHLTRRKKRICRIALILIFFSKICFKHRFINSDQTFCQRFLFVCFCQHQVSNCPIIHFTEQTAIVYYDFNHGEGSDQSQSCLYLKVTTDGDVYWADMFCNQSLNYYLCEMGNYIYNICCCNYWYLVLMGLRLNIIVYIVWLSSYLNYFMCFPHVLC